MNELRAIERVQCYPWPQYDDATNVETLLSEALNHESGAVTQMTHQHQRLSPNKTSDSFIFYDKYLHNKIHLKPPFHWAIK